jgi:hypothetical protein
MPVGFPTKADYATGDVLTAANMNDLAGTLNTVPNTIGTGNAIINGGMDIWQRGTSFGSASVYTADRWFKDAQTYSTVSQQTTSDTTNLPTIFYSARIARNVGQTGTSPIGIITSLESLDSYRFAGQTVTLSFYARAGANFSATSSLASADIYTGTGTNQRRDFSTAFTGDVAALSSTATLTTTWKRFTFTTTLAATATEIAVRVRYSPSGTAGANDWMEVTGVQLELGSTATTFKRSNGAGGTIQGELAACQRYFWRQYGNASNVTILSTGFQDTTSGYFPLIAPVLMRGTPTGGVSANADIILTNAGGTATTTLANFDVLYPYGAALRLQTSNALTSGQACSARIATGATKYIELSAEL